MMKINASQIEKLVMKKEVSKIILQVMKESRMQRGVLVKGEPAGKGLN